MFDKQDFDLFIKRINNCRKENFLPHQLRQLLRSCNYWDQELGCPILSALYKAAKGEIVDHVEICKDLDMLEKRLVLIPFS